VLGARDLKAAVEVTVDLVDEVRVVANGLKVRAQPG